MPASLLSRWLTAAVLIPPLVLAVVYLETMAFGLVLGAVVCLAAWEWSHLAGLERPSQRIAYLAFIAMCMFGCYQYLTLAIALPVLLFAALWWLFALGAVILVQCRDKNIFTCRPLKMVAGLFVLLPPWLSLILIHESSAFSVHPVLFLFVLIWTADAGAYFVGRRWGKAKLADKVSPGKTWVGVGGALASAASIGLLYALLRPMQLFEFSIFLFLCLVTILASVLGDLLESMIKRSANLKDSGALLPGHGGVLDRIDSLTAAAPVFLIGLWLMERLP